MKWIQPSELNGKTDYCVPLLAKLVRNTLHLIYWTGESFYDYHNNRMVPNALIKQVSVIVMESESDEPFTANVKVVDQQNIAASYPPPTPVVKETPPAEEQQGGGMFSFDDDPGRVKRQTFDFKPKDDIATQQGYINRSRYEWNPDDGDNPF